jgi:hypothetical protein
MLRATTSFYRCGLLGLVLAVLPVLPDPSFADTASPCFDVRVEFRGREPTENVNNVQFYRWTYRVYGNSCINRALSHWILGTCASTLLSNISTQSVDASDPPGGLVTSNVPTVGKDLTTGVPYGVKWNYVYGNRLDKLNEYDEFSFIASGPITTLAWAAMGATTVVTGTTLGPGCLPVPVQTLTWSGVKTRFND